MSGLLLLMGFAGAAWPAAVAHSPQPAAAPAPVTLTVSAAASLKDALTEVQNEFGKSRPDIRVQLNFGASGTLETQIEQGAPADVFLSAGTQQMDQLATKGLVLAPTRVNLLRNELVLIVPRDSNKIKTFGDLARPDVRVVAVGDPRSVPAGEYAQQTLAAMGLAAALKGKLVLGTDVRQVLADVETASADAGIVYSTDAAISHRVRVVAEAPPGTHRPIVYPAAVLRDSAHPDAARTFLQYLESSQARAVFQRFGFVPAER